MPRRDCLLVLNYHRIGDPADSVGDPRVFSASAEEFRRQVAFLREHYRPIGLEEAVRFVEGHRDANAGGARVLLTFDDGYLDNYRIAYPILKAHGVPATFFIATTFVGSSELPWWDGFAYVLRNTTKRALTLTYPESRTIELAAGIDAAFNELVDIYRSPSLQDPRRFYDAVCEAAEVDPRQSTARLFLNWNEAREMLAGGMDFGSHTTTHPIIGWLPPERQFAEVADSKTVIEGELANTVTTLAYPTGTVGTFTDHTFAALRRAGYRAAFSFYGGVNLPRRINPYDVRRMRLVHYELTNPLWRLRLASSAVLGRSLM